MATRPEPHLYYMGLAVSAASRAECSGRKVGAVIARNNRVISTGYNGVPDKMKNCTEGGCVRCSGGFKSGQAYDICICVHAEMNAIAAAAKYGHAVENATAYVTHQPCFTCAKELIQAGIKKVYYAIELPVTYPDAAIREKLKPQHEDMMERLDAEQVDPSSVAIPLKAAIEQFLEEQPTAANTSS